MHELEVYRSGSESGDGGSETVVGPRSVIPGSGDPYNPDDEIGVRINVAAVDVNHVRFLDDCFAVQKRELDTVIAGFHFERESAGIVRCYPLTFPRVNVDNLDRSAFDCARAFGSADGAADGAVCLDGLGAEVDDGATMAGSQTQQRHRYGNEPTAAALVRAVEPDFPHIVPLGMTLQGRGHCAHLMCYVTSHHIAVGRKRRRVIEDDRTAIAPEST